MWSHTVYHFQACIWMCHHPCSVILPSSMLYVLVYKLKVVIFFWVSLAQWLWKLCITILLKKKKKLMNCSAAKSRANIVIAASVSPKVKGCKRSPRVNIIPLLWDKTHEGKQLDNITTRVHLWLAPFPQTTKPCALLPDGITGPSAAPSTWSQPLRGKMHIACQQTTSSHHQWHSVWGSWGRGEAEMKCGSHRRCVQLAMFFHSAGGTANLFLRSIYGSKQDASSGIEVVCHM